MIFSAEITSTAPAVNLSDVDLAREVTLYMDDMRQLTSSEPGTVALIDCDNTYFDAFLLVSHLMTLHQTEDTTRIKARIFGRPFAPEELDRRQEILHEFANRVVGSLVDDFDLSWREVANG